MDFELKITRQNGLFKVDIKAPKQVIDKREIYVEISAAITELMIFDSDIKALLLLCVGAYLDEQLSGASLTGDELMDLGAEVIKNSNNNE